MIDLDVLHSAIPPALGVARNQMAVMNTSGLAHAHVRLGESCPWIARIPLHSQHGRAPLENLRTQAACFNEVAPSGHSPRLHSTIAPQTGLPMGALIVEYIDGPLIELPTQLPLLADAFATIHTLPATGRLPRHANPLEFLRAEIAEQAKALDGLDNADSRAQLDEELRWLATFDPPEVQPIQLVVTDSHPGNFFVRDGCAIIVDLEKALYGSAMIDLAHATIYTSTTWEAQNAAVLSDAQVASFYTRYLAQDDRARCWAIPMRRILWLRAITWCAHWRAENAKAINAWQDINDRTRAHVAERTAHFLTPEIIAQVRRDWRADGLVSLI